MSGARRLAPALLPLAAAGLVLAAAIAGLWAWPSPGGDRAALLDQRLASIEARLAALEGDRRLDAALEQAAARRGEVEQRLAALEARPDPRERLAVLEARLSELVAARSASPAQVAVRADQLAERLDGLARRLEALAAEAARLASPAGAPEPRIAALEARSRRLAGTIAAGALLGAGQPLAPALALLPAAPPALLRFAAEPPPTEAALRLGFEAAARAALAAGEPARDGQGVLDSAAARLAALVTVRRGEETLLGDAAGAELDRARRALEAGDLEAALAPLRRLSAPARAAMAGWTGQAEALLAARAALRALALD